MKLHRSQRYFFSSNKILYLFFKNHFFPLVQFVLFGKSYEESMYHEGKRSRSVSKFKSWQEFTLTDFFSFIHPLSFLVCVWMLLYPTSYIHIYSFPLSLSLCTLFFLSPYFSLSPSFPSVANTATSASSSPALSFASSGISISQMRNTDRKKKKRRIGK